MRGFTAGERRCSCLGKCMGGCRGAFRGFALHVGWLERRLHHACPVVPQPETTRSVSVLWW
jgi:hypothetical protein